MIKQGTYDLDLIAGFWPVQRVDISISSLLQTMDQFNITGGMLTSARGVFYDDHAGNLETLSWCEEDARFLPVATLNPVAYLSWKEKVDELQDRGVVFWRFFPEYQGWDTEHPVFLQMLEYINRKKSILYIDGQLSSFQIALRKWKGSIICSCHFYYYSEVLALGKNRTDFYLTTKLLQGPGMIN